MGYRTVISEEHNLGTSVPEIIVLKREAQVGDKVYVDYREGTVFQYYTGEMFKNYVAILSFEKWDTERCPRFAVYDNPTYIGIDDLLLSELKVKWHLCQDVSEILEWPR